MIGILGAGAIGCYVGGKLANAGEDIILLGRQRFLETFQNHPLTIKDETGSITVTDHVKASQNIADLQNCRIIFFAVKSLIPLSLGDSVRFFNF